MPRILLSISFIVLFVISGSAKPVTKAEVSGAVYELLTNWDRPGSVEIVRMEPHYLSDGSLAF